MSYDRAACWFGDEGDRMARSPCRVTRGGMANGCAQKLTCMHVLCGEGHMKDRPAQAPTRTMREPIAYTTGSIGEALWGVESFSIGAQDSSRTKRTRGRRTNVVDKRQHQLHLSPHRSEFSRPPRARPLFSSHLLSSLHLSFFCRSNANTIRVLQTK
jgi:hypothetical protein